MVQLRFPDELYGRDKDISILLESFEHISSGQGQVLLIPAYSGVKKTALVHELHQYVEKQIQIYRTSMSVSQCKSSSSNQRKLLKRWKSHQLFQ